MAILALLTTQADVYVLPRVSTAEISTMNISNLGEKGLFQIRIP